jgi:hypothetical protein
MLQAARQVHRATGNDLRSQAFLTQLLHTAVPPPPTRKTNRLRASVAVTDTIDVTLPCLLKTAPVLDEFLWGRAVRLEV